MQEGKFIIHYLAQPDKLLSWNQRQTQSQSTFNHHLKGKAIQRDLKRLPRLMQL